MSNFPEERTLPIIQANSILEYKFRTDSANNVYIDKMCTFQVGHRENGYVLIGSALAAVFNCL